MDRNDIRLVALVDTETSGLDPSKDNLLEVAVILFDVVDMQMVEARTWLFHAEKNDAEKVNGIPTSLLYSRGRTMTSTLDLNAVGDMAQMIQQSDVVLAWNAAFDAPWVRKLLTSMDVVQAEEDIPPWVCAMEDLSWPRFSSSKALTSVALAHGVGVSHAHRALSDTLTMMYLFQRAHELGMDVRDEIHRGLRPKSEYRALVTRESKDLAKRAGFRYDGEKTSWFKVMFDDEVESLDFRVEKVREVVR